MSSFTQYFQFSHRFSKFFCWCEPLKNLYNDYYRPDCLYTPLLNIAYRVVSNKTCSYKLLQQLQNCTASHACPFTNWVGHHKTNVSFTESLGIWRHVLSRTLSSSIIPYTSQTHIGSYGLFFLPLSLTSFWRSHEKSSVNTEENWACLWHWCQEEIKAVLWNCPGGALSRRCLVSVSWSQGFSKMLLILIGFSGPNLCAPLTLPMRELACHWSSFCQKSRGQKMHLIGFRQNWIWLYTLLLVLLFLALMFSVCRSVYHQQPFPEDQVY